jgi:hypothetical protein
MINKHRSGAVEIHTDGQMLVLTDEEYKAALRRGCSVCHNRRISESKKNGNQNYLES